MNIIDKVKREIRAAKIKSDIKEYQKWVDACKELMAWAIDKSIESEDLSDIRQYHEYADFQSVAMEAIINLHIKPLKKELDSL